MTRPPATTVDMSETAAAPPTRPYSSGTAALCGSAGGRSGACQFRARATPAHRTRPRHAPSCAAARQPLTSLSVRAGRARTPPLARPRPPEIFSPARARCVARRRGAARRLALARLAPHPLERLVTPPGTTRDATLPPRNAMAKHKRLQNNPHPRLMRPHPPRGRGMNARSHDERGMPRRVAGDQFRIESCIASHAGNRMRRIDARPRVFRLVPGGDVAWGARGLRCVATWLSHSVTLMYKTLLNFTERPARSPVPCPHARERIARPVCAFAAAARHTAARWARR